MLRPLLSLSVRLGITVLLGVLFALLCFQYDWLRLVDLKMYDLGLSLRPQAESPSDVVVVTLDRYSRESCFQPPHFPISAHLAQHSQVIERLSEAGAKVIAFDILFDQLNPELDLEPFVSALNKAGNVILAGVMEAQALKVTGSNASIQEERVILPVPAIPSSSYQVGLVNVPVGPDHVARQSYYGRQFQGKWYPSLPAAAVSGFLGEAAPRLRSSEPFYIDYSSPERGLLTVRYADVLKAADWQDLLRGRIALIGVNESGLEDTHKSPVSGLSGATQGRKLPGVFFLAYAIQTLLGDDVVATLSAHLCLLLSVLLVLGSSVLALGSRQVLNLVLVIVLIMVVSASGVALTALSVTILPTGKLMAVKLVAAAVGMFVNFSYTKLRSSEQEGQLQEISSDLKAAQQIQRKLQPEKIPALEGVEISGLQIPCKEIGGDYYDVIQLDQKRIAVLVADVSGKGISGALVMSNLQSVVRTLAPKVPHPSELLPELSRAVAEIATPGRFVTLFYGILDLATRNFLYGNAGHNYPVLCRAGGETSELSEGGLFLGPFPDASWQDSEIQLENGDLLFIYTDGVTEASRGKTEEQFGEERLKEYLRENLFQSPEQINRRLTKVVEKFTGSRQFEDDLTVLTLKIV
ncbi:MAG: SpoIIE family protein phosphatase [Candidatus Zixiibacteriota bacterium]|nr:MAG: SpoIIE family protein phosphatase [candidate division Zixibacteria bacterium]